MKKRLCVSFSGGETSGYMAWYVKNHLESKYDEVIYIFANTGQENEETLIFADQCDKAFGLNLIWLEAQITNEIGKGTRGKVVTFETASRNGEPFEEGIKKFGLPNLDNSWCTRDLKLVPIQRYITMTLKWKKYDTAIGIRADEVDRVSVQRKEKRLIYPLVSDQPMNKPKVNFWWSNQAFRLQLKGYEGNCKWCWKKSKNKLMTIAKERPEYFDFPKRVEWLYEDYIPPTKSKSLKAPIRMFRGNLSVRDIIRDSNLPFKKQHDDSEIYNWQISLFDQDLDSSNGCDESCEVY